MTRVTRRTLISSALAGAVGALSARGASSYRIIDPHVHVWKLDERFPWAKETRNPPTEDATAEMLLELMRPARSRQNRHYPGDSLSVGQ